MTILLQMSVQHPVHNMLVCLLNQKRFSLISLPPNMLGNRHSLTSRDNIPVVCFCRSHATWEYAQGTFSCIVWPAKTYPRYIVTYNFNVRTYAGYIFTCRMTCGNIPQVDCRRRYTFRCYTEEDEIRMFSFDNFGHFSSKNLQINQLAIVYCVSPGSTTGLNSAITMVWVL